MALQSARQLLDELMGRERDLRPSEKNSEDCEWSDDRICKFFLVKFCPNQLFTNTKADMGPCHKVHDDYIKKIYEDRAPRKEKLVLEEEFIRFCQQTLNDVERRIKRAKQRLAANQAEKNNEGNEALNAPYLSEELQEKIQKISEKIDELLLKIEELGCEGKVEEAQETMKDVEKLKEEKIAIKRDNMPMHWIQQRAEIGAAQEKQMEVCDVCGAFLIVNDVQQRVDDHLMGKQHVGYGKLKTALDDLLSRRKVDDNVNSESGDLEEKEKVDSGKSRIRSRSRSKERHRNGLSRYDDKRSRNNSHRSSKHRDHSSSSRHHRRTRDTKYRSRSRSKDRKTSTKNSNDRSGTKSRKRSTSGSPRK